MTKTQFGFLILALVTISFSSCTVEKRIYQDGYHVSLNRHFFSKHKIDQNKIEDQISTQNNLSSGDIPVFLDSKPNVHSIETISVSSNERLILSPKVKTIVNLPKDTVIPKEEIKQEEYFDKNYSVPIQNKELQDVKLANWALGLGIGSVSAPFWIFMLFLLIAAVVGASWSSINVWAALFIALLLGGSLFIVMEILAIVFAVRFLRLHAKDPNYRKYRSRAITGLILASIYPALIVLNIFLTLAFI